MDEVWVANKRFKSALDSFMAQAEEQDEKERRLNKRLAELDRKKAECAKKYGNRGAKENDMVKINVGGKIVRAKRSILTQLKGTKFEWLFSGRWEKKLPSDKDGHIFLDVDPNSFQSIVDYLNALAISSDVDPPEFSGLEDDGSVGQYLGLFGLSEQIRLDFDMPDSEIIKDEARFKIIQSWLDEDGSDGRFSLLYRSSRDGLSNEEFHSNCDGKGSTLMIVETKKGLVFGGYSNIPWESSGGFKDANKAFIFFLSGNGVNPTKIKSNIRTGETVQHTGDYGPVFGCKSWTTMYVASSRFHLHYGVNMRSVAYVCPRECGSFYGTHKIKKMEVFQIEKSSQCPNSVPSIPETQDATQDISDALERKVVAVNQAEQKISSMEEEFEKERRFVDSIASYNEGGVVVLDVSGTIMTTKRSTLRIIDDSVLARQFDESVWTEQGNRSKFTNEWTPDDVEKWVNSIEGIPEGASDLLKQKVINGPQLLALDMDELERILGFDLVDKIRKIQEESEEVLIDHSPYCFGKILDFLRLKRLHSLGLVTEPSLPVVHDFKKDLFGRVVRYYFPGETSKCILG